MGRSPRQWFVLRCGPTQTPGHQGQRLLLCIEQIKLAVEGRELKWTVAEIFKDHSAMAGIDVFTVRVDETEVAEGEG